MNCYECKFVKRDPSGVPVVAGDDVWQSDRDRFYCSNIQRLQDLRAKGFPTMDKSDRIVGMNDICELFEPFNIE